METICPSQAYKKSAAAQKRRGGKDGGKAQDAKRKRKVTTWPLVQVSLGLKAVLPVP